MLLEQEKRDQKLQLKESVNNLRDLHTSDSLDHSAVAHAVTLPVGCDRMRAIFDCSETKAAGLCLKCKSHWTSKVRQSPELPEYFSGEARRNAGADDEAWTGAATGSAPAEDEAEEPASR